MTQNKWSQQIEKQHEIQDAISTMFAPEDEGLHTALAAAQKAGLPAIQISPIQGKLLQLLAFACHARHILEIGSLAGYSGIWLARALPADGRLITLELNPHHAEVVRQSFASAGVGNKTEVRIGSALQSLPQLVNEAPFDLVFIDADKGNYPAYLDWALKLTRPGSIIIADNTIWGGAVFEDASDTDTVGLRTYNQQAASNPRLQSLALPLDDGYTDGFTISVVLP